MKNLIIAALAAAQVMDWWYIYCRSGEDTVWCTLTLFFFFLLLLYWMDKQAEKLKRIHETSNKIKRLTEGENYGNNFTLAEVTHHLDELVRLREEYNASCHMTNHIYAEKLPKEIYHPEGLDQMADVLGIKVEVDKHSMGGDKRYFVYKGYCIYQWGGEGDE